MKKTFSININGLLFNIDEDAFEKLSSYIKTLKNHFQNTEGCDEIVSDIETRIAEIIKMRTTDLQQIITVNDVDFVIETLGQPSEMDDEDEGKSTKKRKGSYSRKRIFRDPDHSVIGGVASGLGAHFNIDPVLIRIFFIISIFLGGVGIVVYLTLWALTPLATTTSEKLEMEGEKVDIHNIEKKVREEMELLKGKFQDFSNEAGDVLKKVKEESIPSMEKKISKEAETLKGKLHDFSKEATELIKTKRKDSAGEMNEFRQFIFAAFRIFFRSLAIIFGIVLLLVGVALSIAFAATYLGLIPTIHFDEFSVGSLSLPAFLNNYIITTPYRLIFNISLFLVLFIPVAGLIISAIRLIFNLGRQKIFGISATLLWVIALMITITLSVKTFEQFKTKSTHITVNVLDTIQSDTLNLIIFNEQYYKELQQNSSGTFYFDDEKLMLSSDDNFYGNSGLTFGKADDDYFELIIHTSARGKNSGEAKERIKNTNYFFELEGNNLAIDPYFTLRLNEKWRDQDISFEIKIPEGKTLYIDKHVRNYFQWHYWGQSRRAMAGNYWIMTENGLIEAGKKEI